MSEVNSVDKKADVTKEQIRTLVSGIYDLQKLRISMGNRLVQSFYQQLGIKPSDSPDNADKEEKKMIDKLKSEYNRISDAMVIYDNKDEKSGEVKTTTVKTAIKKLNQSKNKEDKLDSIRNETDYRMVKAYIHMLESEEESIKALDKIVKEHPMWDAFFKDVKGCGTLMSAVCIAYFDPYKANHVSSFFKYAGLDVVQDIDSEGRMLFLAVDDNKKKVYMEVSDCGEPTYKYTDTNKIYEGEVIPSTHGRRKGDTEMQPYYVVNDKGEKVLATDDDGNLKLKKGITYNPKLKTKLMGVLSGCLMKAGMRKDSSGESNSTTKYGQIYIDQRHRLDNSAYHMHKSSAQKNAMAQRYMIKEFVRDMWITWRTIEGLEVDEPYEVAKLGHRPHNCKDILKE